MLNICILYAIKYSTFCHKQFLLFLVFKSRLQSPGKGGALLVGKSAASPLFIGKNRNIELQTLHSSSNSDFDSDFSSDYLMAKKKKAKCKRKTTKSNSLKVCAF